MYDTSRLEVSVYQSSPSFQVLKVLGVRGICFTHASKNVHLSSPMPVQCTILVLDVIWDDDMI